MRPKVLILEQLPAWREYYQGELEEVTEFFGHYAIIHAQRTFEENPDIRAVILDVKLDDGDGVDFVYYLKDNQFSGLIIAASQQIGGTDSLMTAGATHKVSKSKAPSLLRELLMV